MAGGRRHDDVAMVHNLISWATSSRTVVILLALALIGVGVYSFLNVNVEAYPDPAPAIVEVVAQYPGASAEEVERLVTIPLEDALAGMPGLTYTRSKSLFQLSHLRNQFDYGIDFNAAKQEVLNRLRTAQLPGRRHAGHLSRDSDRRNLSLHDRESQRCRESWDLQHQRSEGDGRLGAGAAVSPRAADRRRDQLRRDREALRGLPRS